MEHEWPYTSYSHASEAIPKDTPEVLGRDTALATYVDASLYHDLLAGRDATPTTYVDVNLYNAPLTGRSVTGILHFVIGLPIGWYNKHQAIVGTSTCSSEFVSTRIAIDRIIDLCPRLRHLDVPIRRPARMLGNNESVVMSSILPHSMLVKGHDILPYRHVRKAFATEIPQFYRLKGDVIPLVIGGRTVG